MADASQPPPTVEENHSNQTANHTSNSDEGTSEILEYSGWLWKRTRISHKWQKTWFCLRKTELLYGSSAQTLSKKIPIVGAQIAETTVDKKQHAFKLKGKDSKRIYYLQAESEDSQQEWMQAICFAKAAGARKDASEACVIQ